ncbi:aromatic acid exporter family protein [Huintestinicola sp.]|uniref:aromatic acid exporter family protein n=1 Tax=Huintestinicola sp. TaxID=2981661 RepID=UPI003D7CCA93
MNIDPVKIIKISFGAITAAAVGYGLELQYAVSAGVICLLTIQDTRKETLKITLKRLIAFCGVTALCAVIFGLFGFGFLQLGAVLLLFLIFCGALDMNEAVAMNSVIATHYFASADISLDMMGNELLLLGAGAGIGVLLNIFMPSNTRKIRRIQTETDERIRRIIGRMAVYITAEDKSDYTGSCFEETDRLLEALRRESVKYIGNSFVSEKDYFYKYVGMRMEQCVILMRIFTDIKRLSIVTSYAEPIAAFLNEMSSQFSEINDAVSLLEDIDGLFAYYSEEALPQSREEFENRALLYHILCDLKSFVSLKAEFADKLDENEKSRYWLAENIT